MNSCVSRECLVEIHKDCVIHVQYTTDDGNSGDISWVEKFINTEKIQRENVKK